MGKTLLIIFSLLGVAGVGVLVYAVYDAFKNPPKDDTSADRYHR